MSEIEFKSCCNCEKIKSREEFSAHRKTSDGLQPRCKICVRAYQQEWNRKNPEKVAAKSKNHRSRNLDKVISRERAYAENNRDAINARARKKGIEIRPLLREKKRIKNSEEPWVNRELDAHKRARGGVAPWSSRNARLEFYKHAHMRTIETGIPHEVNHKVPLQSKYVSGLHCEANLEVITMSKNRKLHNGCWPDMPDELKRKPKP